MSEEGINNQLGNLTQAARTVNKPLNNTHSASQRSLSLQQTIYKYKKGDRLIDDYRETERENERERSIANTAERESEREANIEKKKERKKEKATLLTLQRERERERGS